MEMPTSAAERKALGNGKNWGQKLFENCTNHFEFFVRPVFCGCKVINFDTMQSVWQRRGDAIASGKKITLLTQHQIRALLAIHEAGNIQKAAVTIRTSQSALSRLLRQLEENLGTPLFHRTGRGVIPTDAGAWVVEYCLESVRRFDKLKQDLELMGASLRGSVSIAMPTSVARMLIVPFIKKFNGVAPQAGLRVYEGFTGNISHDLSHGRIDIGVIYADSSIGRANSERIVIDDLFFVTSAGSKKIRGESVKFDQIRTEPLLLPSRTPGIRGLVDREFARLGVTPNIAMELDATVAILDLVAEGNGATLCSYSMVKREVLEGYLTASRVVSPSFSREIWVVTAKDKPMTSAAKVAAQLLRQMLLEAAQAAKWRAI